MLKKISSIILIVLLVLSLGTLGYIFTKNLTLENNNHILKKNIKESTKNNDNIIEETNKHNEELDELKEKLKEKISEYEVWKETKEKIKTIIG